MEFMLLLWDELDDLTGACRHLVTSAADEVVSVVIPLAAAASALGAGLLAYRWELLAGVAQAASSGLRVVGPIVGA
jgi:hypothetical protein